MIPAPFHPLQLIQARNRLVRGGSKVMCHCGGNVMKYCRVCVDGGRRDHWLGMVERRQGRAGWESRGVGEIDEREEGRWWSTGNLISKQVMRPIAAGPGLENSGARESRAYCEGKLIVCNIPADTAPFLSQGCGRRVGSPVLPSSVLKTLKMQQEPLSQYN